MFVTRRWTIVRRGSHGHPARPRPRRRGARRAPRPIRSPAAPAPGARADLLRRVQRHGGRPGEVEPLQQARAMPATGCAARARSRSRAGQPRRHGKMVNGDDRLRRHGPARELHLRPRRVPRADRARPHGHDERRRAHLAEAPVVAGVHRERHVRDRRAEPNNTSQFNTFIHFGTVANWQKWTTHYVDPSQWHTIVMDWHADLLEIFVDGVLSFSISDRAVIPDVLHHVQHPARRAREPDAGASRADVRRLRPRLPVAGPAPACGRDGPVPEFRARIEGTDGATEPGRVQGGARGSGTQARM